MGRTLCENFGIREYADLKPIMNGVLDFDMVAVHNACAAIINTILVEVVDPKLITDYAIIWDLDKKPRAGISTASNGVGLMGSFTATIHYISFTVGELGKGLTIYFIPSTGEIVGPGDALEDEMRIPSNIAKMTWQDFGKKYAPQKESSTGLLRDPGDKGNSPTAIRRAAILVESTIKRELDVDSETARAYAEEFAEKKGANGELTEEFMGSTGFYYAALREFSSR